MRRRDLLNVPDIDGKELQEPLCVSIQKVGVNKPDSLDVHHGIVEKGKLWTTHGHRLLMTSALWNNAYVKFKIEGFKGELPKLSEVMFVTQNRIYWLKPRYQTWEGPTIKFWSNKMDWCYRQPKLKGIDNKLILVLDDRRRWLKDTIHVYPFTGGKSTYEFWETSTRNIRLHHGKSLRAMLVMCAWTFDTGCAFRCLPAELMCMIVQRITFAT